MKIVIDISEEIYEHAKDKTEDSNDEWTTMRAIANGTLLPRGHSRLIDAREYESSIRKHYFDNSTVIRCTEIALDNAPTIIEADDGGEQK